MAGIHTGIIQQPARQDRISGGPPSWGCGTRMRHNFLQHVMSTGSLMTRSDTVLDDYEIGPKIIQNIFYKTGMTRSCPRAA